MGATLGSAVCSPACATLCHNECGCSTPHCGCTGEDDTIVEGNVAPFNVALFAGFSSNLPLGITARAAADDPECLRIEHIGVPSLISDWNRVNNEAVRVKIGDVISQVNGVYGSTSGMLDEILSAGLSPDFSELVLEIWSEEMRNIRNLRNLKHQPVLEQQSWEQGATKGQPQSAEVPRSIRWEGPIFTRENSWPNRMKAKPQQAH